MLCNEGPGFWGSRFTLATPKLKMTSFPMQEKYEAHSGMYQGLVGKFGGLEQQNIALELDMIPHSSRS